uniref:Uncharacterized protein n=1 Tax=Steinernema glaseri TaxID=37863 RepID=A0A1I7ZCG2_9BILA
MTNMELIFWTLHSAYHDDVSDGVDPSATVAVIQSEKGESARDGESEDEVQEVENGNNAYHDDVSDGVDPEAAVAVVQSEEGEGARDGESEDEVQKVEHGNHGEEFEAGMIDKRMSPEKAFFLQRSLRGSSHFIDLIDTSFSH